jgi:hypothetical protein
MIRPVAPLVSLGLAVLTAAMLLVGMPVVVAPGRTDRYFAWTLDVPLTAAFLGACYWTAALFTLLCTRERTWARVRCVTPGVLIAGTLILAATLIHLDKFAMDTVRGWVWLVLYALLPPGTLSLLAIQSRQPGVDPPVQHPFERPAAIAFAVVAAALLLAGVALFAVPGTTADAWPWPLTDLAARMVGSWLVAIGITLIAILHEGDWARVRHAMVYLAAVALAHLATLARYPGTVQWDDPAAWVLVGLDVSLLVLAVHGLRRRATPPPRAPQPEATAVASSSTSSSGNARRATPSRVDAGLQPASE